MGRFGYLMSFRCFFASGQISNTESELKKLAEENPDLQDAYIAKQKRLKVRKLFVFPPPLYYELYSVRFFSVMV